MLKITFIPQGSKTNLIQCILRRGWRASCEELSLVVDIFIQSSMRRFAIDYDDEWMRQPTVLHVHWCVSFLIACTSLLCTVNCFPGKALGLSMVRKLEWLSVWGMCSPLSFLDDNRLTFMPVRRLVASFALSIVTKISVFHYLLFDVYACCCSSCVW